MRSRSGKRESKKCPPTLAQKAGAADHDQTTAAEHAGQVELGRRAVLRSNRAHYAPPLLPAGKRMSPMTIGGTLSSVTSSERSSPPLARYSASSMLGAVSQPSNF